MGHEKGGESSKTNILIILFYVHIRYQNLHRMCELMFSQSIIANSWSPYEYGLVYCTFLKRLYLLNYEETQKNRIPQRRDSITTEVWDTGRDSQSWTTHEELVESVSLILITTQISIPFHYKIKSQNSLHSTMWYTFHMMIHLMYCIIDYTYLCIFFPSTILYICLEQADISSIRHISVYRQKQFLKIYIVFSSERKLKMNLSANWVELRTFISRTLTLLN